LYTFLTIKYVALNN